MNSFLLKNLKPTNLTLGDV